MYPEKQGELNQPLSGRLIKDSSPQSITSPHSGPHFNTLTPSYLCVFNTSPYACNDSSAPSISLAITYVQRPTAAPESHHITSRLQLGRSRFPLESDARLQPQPGVFIL